MIIEMIPPPVSENTSPGVTPGVVFSRSGTVTTGGYLQAASVISSNCGYPIFGKNKIVKIRITNASVVATDTVVRFQVRTGLATFADLTGAQITILSGFYSAVASVDIHLPEDPEISCYLVSGSNLSNPIVNCFLYPDYG